MKSSRILPEHGDWSSLDDGVLIKAHLRGEKAAFEVLFKKYREMVSRLVASVVRNDALVQDVVQEVFLLAYRHLGKFRQDAAFKTWIYRIAVNEAIRHLGRAQRWQPLPEAPYEPDRGASTLVNFEGGGSPERVFIDGEMRAAVHRGLDELKPAQRAILNLYYLEEMSVQDIAAVLEIPEGSVKSRLFYAREALKQVLEPVAAPATAWRVSHAAH